MYLYGLRVVHSDADRVRVDPQGVATHVQPPHVGGLFLWGVMCGSIEREIRG